MSRRELPLGARDRSQRLHIPITGPSGIGKSAVARELARPVAEKHGVFISGKLDRLKRGVPYEPFMRAFSALAQSLLGGRRADVDVWCARIMTEVGEDGGVLLEVLPNPSAGRRACGPELGIPGGARLLRLRSRGARQLMRGVGQESAPRGCAPTCTFVCGGRASVASRLRAGSTFTVCVPRDDLPRTSRLP